VRGFVLGEVEVRNRDCGVVLRMEFVFLFFLVYLLSCRY
jgi:hypothetical protein